MRNLNDYSCRPSDHNDHAFELQTDRRLNRRGAVSACVAASPRQPLSARNLAPALLCAIYLGIAVLAWLLVSPVHAQSDTLEPAEVWYRAFVIMKEGEALELNGDRLGALAKYNESKQFFDHVYHQFPDFHREIVIYRRRELAKQISDLRTSMRQGAAGQSPTGPLASAEPQVAENGIVLPSDPTQQRPINSSPEFPAPIQPETVPNGASPPVAYVPERSVTPTPIAQENPIERVNQYYQQMKAEVDRLDNLNKSLQQQLNKSQQELSSYQTALTEARQREQALREQMKNNSGASPETVKELKRQLGDAMQLAKEANARSDQLLAELETSRKEYAALKEERDQILSERDKYAAMMDPNAGKQQLAKLISENERLRDELESTRKEAEQLRKESGDKDIELAKLKAQLTRIEQERSQLLEDNALHQRHIAELQDHLKELGKSPLIGAPVEVASVTSASPDTAKAVAENTLLRGIVLRQLSRQNQIKQAKEALIDQLEELGVETASVLASVDDIVEGASLSVAERDLIRKPSMDESAGPIDTPFIVADPDKGIVAVQSMAEELAQTQKAARLDYVEGNFDAARDGYEKYLRLDPRSVEGTCNLAQVLMQLKDLSGAESLLEKAIALDKKAGRPYYLLGVVFYQQGKMDEALGQLELGIEHHPENARAHNYIGVICADHKGWRKRAVESFTASITHDPEFADPHFNLAVLHSGGDSPDPTKARQHYSKALELGADRDTAIEQFIDTACSGIPTAPMLLFADAARGFHGN